MQSQPAQTDMITRIDIMRAGAAFLMIGAFLAGAILLLLMPAVPDRHAMLFGGLHAVDFGAIMLVSVGALHGHRAILVREAELIQGQERTLQLIEESEKRIQQEIAEVARVEHRILDAASNDLSGRRANHN
jgi:hypothetical protein